VKSINPARSFAIDGVTINIYYASRGEGLPEHSHSHDHVTACISGACLVTKLGAQHTVNAGSVPVRLRAPDPHEIEAIEDGTVFINVLGQM
jgi:quercetin dioxygenase-like cupin family protein